MGWAGIRVRGLRPGSQGKKVEKVFACVVCWLVVCLFVCLLMVLVFVAVGGWLVGWLAGWLFNAVAVVVL